MERSFYLRIIIVLNIINLMKILVVIPCYNEENRLPINEYRLFLEEENNSSIHLKFLNDGSTDNTLRVIQNLVKDYHTASYISFKENEGKANTIRKGIIASANEQYEYIGFIDGDLAIPLEELSNFIQIANHKIKYALISAARVRLLGYSNINNTVIRHIISRGFATVVSFILKLPIYDTQCGAKLYHKSIYKIFNQPFMSKWLFDIEILFRLKKLIPNCKEKIYEIPLKQCINPPGSKIKLSYYFKAPLDLLKIVLHYR